MASINGFQLKNVNRITGREGIGCSGTMYLNGKKIGTYCNYADGREPDVIYISREAELEMVKLVLDYAKTHPNEYIVKMYKENQDRYEDKCRELKKHYPDISDKNITIESMAGNSIEYIITDFLLLLGLEKTFKKYHKKGFKAISVHMSSNNWSYDIEAYPDNWTDKRIEEKANGRKIYWSLDDFNI